MEYKNSAPVASNFFVEKFVHFYIGIFYGIFIKKWNFGSGGPKVRMGGTYGRNDERRNAKIFES